MNEETLRMFGVIFAAVLLNWRMLAAHRDHTEKWIASMNANTEKWVGSLSKRVDDLNDKQ